MTYILHLRDAAKVATGVYQWAFSHQNQERPVRLTVGPANVCADQNLKEVVIKSSSFRTKRRQFALRGNSLEEVLCVVHPEERISLLSTSTTETSSGGGSTDPEAFLTQLQTDSRLVLWMKMDSTSTLDTAYMPVSAMGTSDIAHVKNHGGGPSNILFSYGYQAKFSRAVIGETIGINTGASWMSILDSVNNPTFDRDAEWSCHMLVKAPMGYVASVFFRNERGASWEFRTDGSIGYKDQTGNFVAMGFQWYPSHDYLLSCRRKYTGGSGDSDGNGMTDSEMIWTIQNLTLNDALFSFTGPDAEAAAFSTDGPNAYAMSFGAANTGFKFLLGPTIHYTGSLDADVLDAQCRTYLQNLYDGTQGSSSSESSSETTTVHSVQLYDSRTRTVALKEPHDVLRSIVLQFEDETGAVFDPSSATIHLDIE